LLALLAAAIGKVLAPRAGGLLLSAALKSTYGLQVSWSAALVFAFLLDLLLGVLIIARGRLRGGTEALCVLSLGLIAHHATALAAGTAGSCGCFGAGLELPAAVPALLAGAMLLLALHDGRMGLETSGSPSVRPALRWPVLAWALVPFVGTALLAPLAAAALERPAESVSREIRARDTWLFVFNPHCESCLAEARSLGPLASRGEVTGIAPAGVDGRERFFQRLGYRMPVEVVAGDLWFDLIESAPPAYYRVDSAGKLVAVDRSALLAAVR